MKVEGKNYRTIWLNENDDTIVSVIDQRFLPHIFVIENLVSVNEVAIAITDMHVRGAGLIGATAAYGMYLAVLESKEKKSFDEHLNSLATKLKSTRPTAVNLEWAVNRQLSAISKGNSVQEKIAIAKETAQLIADEDADYCKKIGEHGLPVIEQISKNKNGEVVNVLTHCNAGWLAFVDYGSATSSIYLAHKNGIKVHVWVDETRPRNQGASLTAWELLQQGVPHTVIADNTGGHLMQHGLVDVVITGADRVTRAGDAANKIGTYLKALAALDNKIPFYVALPSSTFDWNITDGIKEIKIEERNSDEVKYMQGLCEGELKTILVTPLNSPALNYGFDVTPSRLISGLITERGICKANEEAILNLFPEKKSGKETGVVKFNCTWIKEDPLNPDLLIDLNFWRDKMFDCGFIGVNEEGIGYGNISIRLKENQFIITGSATGKFRKLTNQHYTKVIDYDLEKNSLTALGPIIASSESLTHAAIYENDKNINSVIHIHNLEMWKKLMDKIPTTNKSVEHGTSALANEIMRLFDETDLADQKILVMAGHEEGIITFGKDLNEAENVLFNNK